MGALKRPSPALLGRLSMLLCGAGLSRVLHFILFHLWELHQQFLPSPSNNHQWITLIHICTCCIFSPLGLCMCCSLYLPCCSRKYLRSLSLRFLWIFAQVSSDRIMLKGKNCRAMLSSPFGNKKKEKCENRDLNFFLKAQKFHPPYPIFILLHSVYHHLIMYRLFICSSRAGIFLFLSFHFYISAPRIVSSTQQALMNICRKTDSMTSLLWHPCWFVATLWFFLTKRESYSEGYYHPPMSLRSS